MHVLIDSSYLAHRARYSLKDLEFEDFPTGVLFGFFEQLLTLCTNPRIKSNNVHLCFDSRQSYRKHEYPAYKATRHKNKTPEEIQELRVMKTQLNLLRREILPAIGFPVYRQTGLESDDIIAHIAAQISLSEDSQAIIITSDGDLYQCITNNVHWYDPGRESYLTLESFYAKKEIDAEKWARVKAIAGCNSDEVKGVPGVGEKTAIQYLKGILPSKYKKFQAIISPEGKAIYKRNLKLVLLPHVKTKHVKTQQPVYSVKIFREVCKEYGFLSYLKGRRADQWMNFFNNKFVTHKTNIRKRGEKRGKRARKRF